MACCWSRLGSPLVCAVVVALVAARKCKKDVRAGCEADTCPEQSAASQNAHAAAEGMLATSQAVAGETLLMQIAHSSRASGVTSDCASRLNHWSERNAACLVQDGGKALLVYVPYGSAPGWDFPGGMKHDNEFACQTAERETCEETGHKVRAIRKLSYNVFECELVAKNVCRKSVDEGFLQKQWVSKQQIDSIRYRGGTWGDKRAILAEHLGGPSASRTTTTPFVQNCNVASWPDKDHGLVCGDCKVLVDRFDTHYGDCKGYCAGVGRQCIGAWEEVDDTCSVKHTLGCDQGIASSDAICQCGDLLAQSPTPTQAPTTTRIHDACGCLACQGEGFSSRRHACAAGSSSDVQESCACLQRHGQGQDGVDSCGCRPCRGEGWSSSRGSCNTGSATSAQEACSCAGQHNLR